MGLDGTSNEREPGTTCRAARRGDVAEVAAAVVAGLLRFLERRIAGARGEAQPPDHATAELRRQGEERRLRAEGA